MKEPWKKTCNGKVIITLNDEKTESTEVELPVDLSWASSQRRNCNVSAYKIIVLLCIGFLLGLTTYALWKVQVLEDQVEDDRNLMTIMKQLLTGRAYNDPFIMMLEEKENENENYGGGIKAEPLIRSYNSFRENSMQNEKQKSSEDDLDSLQSQYSNSNNNKLNVASKKEESKEIEIPNRMADNEESPKETFKSIVKRTNASNDQPMEQLDENNNQNSDSGELIKPLVETFDVFGNNNIEDHFIYNVLMKMLIPEKDFELVEFNKMYDANVQDDLSQKQHKKVLPLPLKNLLFKGFEKPGNDFKIIHLNEKPEIIQENKPMPRIIETMKMKLIPTVEKERIPFPIAPPHMKIMRLNNEPNLLPNMQDDFPKITIQRMKLKFLTPIATPEEEFVKKNEPMSNFEVIHFNEPAPPANPEEEAVKILPLQNANPLPMAVQDIIKNIFPMIDKVALNNEEDQVPKRVQKEAKLNPLPMEPQDIVNLLSEHANKFDLATFGQMMNEPQEPERQDINVFAKMPVQAMKLNPYQFQEPFVNLAQQIVSNFETPNEGRPKQYQSLMNSDEPVQPEQGASPVANDGQLPWENQPTPILNAPKH